MFVVKYHVGADEVGMIVLRRHKGMLRDWYVVAVLPHSGVADSTVVHFDDGTDWSLHGFYEPQELLSMMSSLGGDDILVETTQSAREISRAELEVAGKEAKGIQRLDRLIRG